jgi:hypothetical protein
VRFTGIGKGSFGEIYFCQYAKERGLADLRQTDDASFHEFSFQLSVFSNQFNQENKSSSLRVSAEYFWFSFVSLSVLGGERFEAVGNIAVLRVIQ